MVLEPLVGAQDLNEARERNKKINKRVLKLLISMLQLRLLRPFITSMSLTVRLVTCTG